MPATINHLPEAAINENIKKAAKISMMPKIGRGKLPGIFYNTGHGHLGWTLSSYSSLLISDYILGTDNMT